MSANNNIVVKDTWLLRFMRNTDCPYEDQGSSVVNQSLRHFYVFDYYDRMVCKHGDLNYDECLGLSGAVRDCYPGASVASSYHTLTCLDSDQTDEGDPFFESEEREQALPFLSLLNVTLVPEDNTKGNNPSEEDIANYLKECTTYLYNRVQEACMSFYKGKMNCEAGEHVHIRVLQSMNSGCFCVVLRTDQIELGYYVAMQIRTVEMDAVCGFPKCQFSTFTTTCMQYETSDQNIAVVPSNVYNCSAEAGIVLRLSVDQDLIKDIAPLSLGVGNGRGLYGRYDVTVELRINQFMQVYPWICACKFGTVYPDEEAVAALGDNTLKALVNILEKRSGVHCINERVLVGCSVLENSFSISEQEESGKRSSQDNATDYHKKHMDHVIAERKSINEKIRKLIKKGNEVPYYEREFIHYISLIDDMWNDFENLRIQDDSFVNGNIFYVQLWVLLDIVDTYLTCLEDESKKYVGTITTAEHEERMLRERIGYKDLIVNLRRAVTCINHFQKLIQSVNQQSFQAPNYDIQMHSDLEKLVIAHTEFARNFLTQRFTKTGELSVRGDDHQAILPIYTVEAYRKSICAMPLFLLPYVNVSHNGYLLCNSNTEKERLLLSIMMPTIDTLGNIYRTIPLICHEVAHNFRIIKRKERNDALCEYIMNKVSRYIVQFWISRNCERSIYVHFGTIVQKIKGFFATSLLEGYHDFVGDIHDTSNIGALISNILTYLCDHIFISQDDYNKSSPVVTPKVLKKCINDIVFLYQEVARTEEASWYRDYKKSLKILDNMGRGSLEESEKKQIHDTVDQAAKDIFAKYTEWYFVQLCELRDYILDNYDLSHEEKISYNRFVAWVNNYLRKTNKSFSFLQNDIDNMITELADEWIKHNVLGNLEFATPKKTHGPSLSSGSKKKNAKERSVSEINREFLQIKNSLWPATQELSQKIKNLSILYLGAHAEVKTYPFQEKLLDEFRGRIRHWIGEMQLDSFLWMIYGAEKIQEYLNPLGIDQESDELFNQTFTSVIRGVANGSIETLVRDSTVLYREVFADLGMCAPLGLTVFGYLMVLSNAKTFRGNGLNDDMHYDSFGIERALTVCSTLSIIEPEDFEKKCHEYFEVMMEEVNGYLTDDGQQLEEYKGFIQQIQELLFTDDRNNANKEIPDLRVFSSCIRNGMDDGYVRLTELMKSMWFFSMYVCCYRTKGNEYINEDLQNHFIPLYEKMKEDRFDVDQDSHVLEKIGQAYNQGLVNLSRYQEEEFKESLSFVLYYYYKNWGTFSWSCDPKEMRTWTDHLMGGV